MPRGDILAFIGIVALAIALAELQVKREATLRYLCLTLIWMILVAMTIYVAYAR
jgi:hypothetical protein